MKDDIRPASAKRVFGPEISPEHKSKFRRIAAMRDKNMRELIEGWIDKEYAVLFPEGK